MNCKMLYTFPSTTFLNGIYTRDNFCNRNLEYFISKNAISSSQKMYDLHVTSKKGNQILDPSHFIY